MRRIPAVFLVSSLVATFALLTGCLNTTRPLPSPTIQRIASTPTSSQLLTPTSTEPLPSSTPSYCIPPSTRPAAPTLTVAEFELLSTFPPNNPECSFPCWSGLTPGVSTATDAFTLLGSLGENAHEVDMRARPFTMYGAVANDSTLAWGFGLSRKCLVDFIQLWPRDVPLREALFADLGVPERALMSIAGPGLFPGGPAVEVFLDFPAARTAIEIRADPRHRARLCLDDSQMTFISVLTYSPSVDPLRVLTQGRISTYSDPAEFTGLAQEDFARIFTTTPECILITSGF